MKVFAGVLLVWAALAFAACPAQADDHRFLPAPTDAAPFPPSIRSGAFAIVPPYGPLPVRIYTTPAQGPFYNVPPYRVVAPY